MDKIFALLVVLALGLVVMRRLGRNSTSQRVVTKKGRVRVSQRAGHGSNLSGGDMRSEKPAWANTASRFDAMPGSSAGSSRVSSHGAESNFRRNLHLGGKIYRGPGTHYRNITRVNFAVGLDLFTRSDPALSRGTVVVTGNNFSGTAKKGCLNLRSKGDLCVYYGPGVTMGNMAVAGNMDNR